MYVQMSCAVYIMSFGLGEPTKLAEFCLALRLSVNLLSKWCLTVTPVSGTSHISGVYMRGWLIATDLDLYLDFTWIYKMCIAQKKKKKVCKYLHIRSCTVHFQWVCLQTKHKWTPSKGYRLAPNKRISRGQDSHTSALEELALSGMACVVSVLASREGLCWPQETVSWAGKCCGRLDCACFRVDREGRGHVLFGGMFIPWDYRSTQKCLGSLSHLCHVVIWSIRLYYYARSSLLPPAGWGKGTFCLR